MGRYRKAGPVGGLRHGSIYKKKSGARGANPRDHTPDRRKMAQGAKRKMRRTHREEKLELLKGIKELVVELVAEKTGLPSDKASFWPAVTRPNNYKWLGYNRYLRGLCIEHHKPLKDFSLNQLGSIKLALEEGDLYPISHDDTRFAEEVFKWTMKNMHQSTRGQPTMEYDEDRDKTWGGDNDDDLMKPENLQPLPLSSSRPEPVRGIIKKQSSDQDLFGNPTPRSSAATITSLSHNDGHDSSDAGKSVVIEEPEMTMHYGAAVTTFKQRRKMSRVTKMDKRPRNLPKDHQS